LVRTRAKQWESEPGHLPAQHQAIPVYPAPFNVVDVVVKNEAIDRAGELEVTRVREQIGLHDGKPTAGTIPRWRHGHHAAGTVAGRVDRRTAIRLRRIQIVRIAAFANPGMEKSDTRPRIANASEFQSLPRIDQSASPTSISHRYA